MATLVATVTLTQSDKQYNFNPQGVSCHQRKVGRSDGWKVIVSGVCQKLRTVSDSMMILL